MTPRLLVVSDSLSGGLGAIAIEHVHWFANRQWQVALASRGNASNGVNCERYHVEIPQSIRQARVTAHAARDLQRVLRAFRPDVVHCHGLRSFALTTLAGGRAALTLHGSGSVQGEFAGLRALRQVGIHVAPFLALHAVTVAPIQGLRGTRVGWQFLPHASPRLKSLDRLAFPAAETPTFLWLGRLDSQKRTDLFIRALAEVATSRDVRGIVAGSGSEEAGLRQLALQRRAPVEFVGSQADIRPLLLRAWAVVLLSRFEGLPLALEEAMWAGRTVITSRLPGAEWLVGDAGWLVEGLDQAVEALLAATDPMTAARLGEAAALRARSVLSPEMPWPEIEAAYNAHSKRRAA